MVGLRLREVRNARGMSMREVASRADISLASLSRIETNQQGLDLGLFLRITKILDVDPTDLLPHERGEADRLNPVLRRISVLSGKDRLELWHKLADQARRSGKGTRRSALNQLRQEVEELLAQIEFIHAQIGAVHKRLQRASTGAAEEERGDGKDALRVKWHP